MHYSAGLLLLAVVAQGAPAAAFHAGSLFDKPPGAGGGGGLFYTGAPLEHGWTCTACHRPNPLAGEVDPAPSPGLLRINLDASIVSDGKYVPGQSYSFNVSFQKEYNAVGLRANFNSLAVTFVDGKGLPAGAISGFSPDDFYQGGSPATVVDAGKKPNNTAWSFTWTAPPAATGTVTFYFCAVDGNAAGVASPDSTLTDPWGDDVVAGNLAFDEGTVAARPPRIATGLVGLAAVVIFWRRRRPR